MHNTHDSKLAAFVLTAAGLISGCATPERMADAAISAHIAQERVGNQMLLLNLVRASLRRPLHFSKIDSMTLTVGSEMPSIDLSLGLGPGGDSRARGVKLAGGGAPTTMDVAPLDSKEFVQGLTTPLSADWMAYFLEQGWHKKTVLRLFIERIDGPLQASSVANQISAWSECSSLKVTLSPGSEYGPPLPLAQLTSDVSLVDALKAGITVREVQPVRSPQVYQLQAPGTESRLSFLGCPPAAKTTANEPQEDQPQKPKPSQVFLIKSNDPRLARSGSSALAIGSEDTNSDPGLEPGVVLRSVERMIRYLGENAKEEAKGLLRVHRGDPPASPAVRVRYEGFDYWIADDDALGDGTSSMGSLALMQQVLLLKSSGNSISAATQALRIRVTR